MSLELNKIAERAYTTAKDKGWWDGQESVEDLLAATKLMLVVSELVEALDIIRLYGVSKVAEVWEENGKPEGFPIEAADVIIRILSYCHRYNVDIEKAVETKLKFNETRPQRHGGKRI